MNYSTASENFTLDQLSEYGVVAKDPSHKFTRRRDSRAYFTINGQKERLHQIAWMLHNKKDIPEGFRVIPKNGNPLDSSEANLILIPKNGKANQFGAVTIKSWCQQKRAQPKPSKPKKEAVLCESQFNYLLRYLEPFTEIEYYRIGSHLVIHPTETNEFIKIIRTVSTDEDQTEADRRFLLLNSFLAPDELIYREFNSKKYKRTNIRDEKLLESYLA